MRYSPERQALVRNAPSETVGFFSTTDAPKPAGVSWAAASAAETASSSGSGGSSSGGGSSNGGWVYEGRKPTLIILGGSMREGETDPTDNYFRFRFCQGSSTATGMTVSYTLGGTATKGSDYTGPLTAGSTFVPFGPLGKKVYFTATDDSIREWTETILLTPTPSAAYVYAGTPPVVGYVTDNDRVDAEAVRRSGPAWGEDDEEKPGILVPLNADDDDNNGVPDKDDANSVFGRG